jgi:hypothetical protein
LSLVAQLQKLCLGLGLNKLNVCTSTRSISFEVLILQVSIPQRMT